MSTNLMAASRQWATRPADERFSSLSDLLTMLRARRARAVAAKRPFGTLRAEAVDGDVVLVGSKGHAQLTNYAFGQLSTLAGAPASYLAKLPAQLAADNLNHGLATQRDGAGDDAIILMDRAPGDDALTARAVTTDSYSRVWDAAIAERLTEFVAANPKWHNPRAYAHGEGDTKRPGYDPETGTVPSGIYAGDRDMFVFLIDGGSILEESAQGMHRGFFVRHSEVGASALRFTGFTFDKVCGNHIVWGARDIASVRIRHVGDADQTAWDRVSSEVETYLQTGTDGIVKRIRNAKSVVLGQTKADALEALLGMIAKGRVEVSGKVAEAALDTAEKREDRYGDPRTLWAAVSGITENSQECTNADAREKLDRAAGKLLEIAF